MVKPVKPVAPSPLASRLDAANFAARADDTIQYAINTGPTYVEEGCDFVEAQVAVAESAAQDLLTTFTDFSGDVNGLTANGVYKLAAGVTNGWTNAGDNDFLFNYYYDASNQVQHGVDNDAIAYMRSKIGGVWRAWATTGRMGQGTPIASAAALGLRADGSCFDITGTVTITSINSWNIGVPVVLQFDAALVLTHNATSLVLPSGANITTAAGDIAVMVEYSAGNWRCVSYQRASGHAVVPACGVDQSWQDMIATRAAVTSYQNTTGRPIQVSPYGVATLRNFQVSSDGSVWVTIGRIGGNYDRQLTPIIPDGWYYRIDDTTTIIGWLELR